jgi:hypothetical protein
MQRGVAINDVVDVKKRGTIAISCYNRCDFQMSFPRTKKIAVGQKRRLPSVTIPYPEKNKK